MNKNLFTVVSLMSLILVMILAFYWRIASSCLHAYSSSKIELGSQIFFSDDQVRDVLKKLNQSFVEYESTNPQQGYCVTIETGSTLHGKITPYGGARTTKLLSGMPNNELDYIKKCPFCLYAKDNFIDSRIVQKFDEISYAVTSLSNQVLVIPVEHYSHLFTTPFETQVIILKNILLMRSQHADKIQRPIEFHCGSAAGQTVFHLHGRTGIYIKNELN